MRKNLYPNDWLRADAKTRARLKEELGVKKSAPAEVMNNKLVTDGVTAEDLLVLDNKKLGEYLGLEEKMYSVMSIDELWEMTLDKTRQVTEEQLSEPASARVDEEVVVPETPESIPAVQEDMTDPMEEPKKGKECCGSLGIRHKKICSENK